MRAIASSWAWGVAILVAGCGSDLPIRDNPSSSPERRLIAGEACDSCTLRLRELVLLGTADDPVAIRDDAASRDCMVAPLHDGRFAVSGLVGGGEVATFRGDGSFSNSRGRRGQGPGELGSDIRIAAGPGDSITVVDDSQGRVGVYTDAWVYSRGFSTPAIFRSWTRLDDGSWIFAQDPASATDPTFIPLRRDGNPLEAIRRPVPEESIPLDSWVVTSSAGGGFWAASIWTYQLFHLNLRGEVDLVVTRESNWFPDGGRYEDGMPMSLRPVPLIRFLREIQPGIMMVASVVPDPAWEAGVPPQPSFEWGRRVFDTRLEVLDVVSATVLATVTTDDWLGAVCGSTLVYTVAEGDDLSLRISVSQPIY